MKKQSTLREMFKYGMVGAVSTVIDVFLLNVFKAVLGWPLWLAVAIGFLGGTVNGYYLNSRWTFHYNTKGQEGLKFAQFAVVAIVGLILTEFIVNAYVSWFGSSFVVSNLTISEYNVGKAIAVALVFFWNFTANKFWTFGVGKIPAKTGQSSSTQSQAL